MPLPRIRPATEEEAKSVAATSDLGPGVSVIAFDPPNGTKPIVAVLRQAFEVDPVHFNGANDRQKAIFMGLLENALAFTGIKQYYMNIHADEEQFLSVLKSWGAEVTSTAPEFRLKKSL